LLAAHEHHRWGTLRNVVAAIRRHHDARYGSDPCGTRVARFLTGHARLYGTAANPVDALRPDEARAIWSAAPDVLGPFPAARLRMMLMVAYGGWLRGGETVALLGGHLLGDGLGHAVFLERPEKSMRCGVVVTLTWPDELGLDLVDTAAAYTASAAAAGITLRAAGPAFPSTADPSRPISLSTYQRDLVRVARAGGVTGRINTHSARRGGATEAAGAGWTVEEILAQGRWRRIGGAAPYVDAADDASADLALDYPSPLASSSPSSPVMLVSNRSASSM
jgi:integrase